MSDAPALLTASEAATRRGVHVGTVNRWVAVGKLRAAKEIRGPKRVSARLFRPEDVDAAAQQDGRRSA